MGIKLKVDMTNAEDGFPLLSEGGYICKVAKITLEDSKSTPGAKYLKWELIIGTGEFKGQKIWHNTSLQAKALFNLRNVIMALGIDVPKAMVNINTDDYIGKIVGISVVHGEYKGKPKAEISDFWRTIKNENGKWVRAAKDAKAAVAEAETEEDEAEDIGAGANVEDIDDIEI